MSIQDKTRLRSSFMKEVIFKKCKGNCSYCGVKLTRSGRNKNTDFTVDHINPKIRDNYDLSNFAGVCLSCNSKKKNKTLEQYVDFLKEKKLFVGKIVNFYGGYITNKKYGANHYKKMSNARWDKKKKVVKKK